METKTVDLALLALRTVLGVIFVAHGAQKLFGAFGGPGLDGWTAAMMELGLRPPALMALLSGLAEFGGGLLLIFGLLTPLGALSAVVVMAFAIATVNGQNGFFNENGGFEYNLALITMAGALILAGAGAYSLDRTLAKAAPRPMGLVLRQVPQREEDSA